MKLEQLVTYEIECLSEDVPIKGNCSAIDDETDLQAEQWIESELNSGNDWAWCTVRVVARYSDGDYGDFEGEAYLGCCSYRSEQDFINTSGYYDDLKAEALESLRVQLRDVKASGSLLELIES